MYTFHALFRTFGTDLHAQSVLSNKISASELRRKFIKSILLVGYLLFSRLKRRLINSAYSSMSKRILKDFSPVSLLPLPHKGT